MAPIDLNFVLFQISMAFAGQQTRKMSVTKAKVCRNDAISQRAPGRKRGKAVAHQAGPAVLVGTGFKPCLSVGGFDCTKIFAETVLQLGHEHALGPPILVCTQISLGHELISLLDFGSRVAVQNSMQSDVDVKRRHGRRHPHQVLDIADHQVFRRMLPGLFLLFFVVVGFKVDEPLQRVRFVAIHPGDPAFQVLVAPIIPFILLTALRR